MNPARGGQAFQDWATQQWVILGGKNIDPAAHEWLIGPFGNQNGIGEHFIDQLAEKEGLEIERNVTSRGLIASIDELNLSSEARARLLPEVVDFYEKTACYTLDLAVKWNPFFRVFGVLVNWLFSNRINQLNIPIRNSRATAAVQSEIITLSDPETKAVKYTLWLRKIRATGRVVYSGVYGTCKLPCGKSGIRAVFPLPNGNATVILLPSVGQNGELVLDSSGKKIGDAGFYFLLNDARGGFWARFVRAFRDRLVVRVAEEGLLAEQCLTLWNIMVVRFRYRMRMI